MKNRPSSIYPAFMERMLFICAALSAVAVLSNCSGHPDRAVETNRVPDIFPEYYNLTIPPNIAPLNFIIREPGSSFRVEISAGTGEIIEIVQRSPDVKIPLRRWQQFLSDNAGNSFTVAIWSFHNKQWHRYTGIEHYIATEPIDPYLTYRLVHAAYLTWHKMGIYQRDLTSFNESPVIENSYTGQGCMNCHSFSNNDPSKMLIHFRILHSGTMIRDGGKLTKIDTRTASTVSAGIYPAWHPDGKHIAFSTGAILPHLTTRLNKPVDVVDRFSDLMVYNTEENTVTTSPRISTELRENMPAWSPDGKYLYYLRAPEATKGDQESLLHSRYSLMRIAYDAERNSWGEAETVLHSDTTGMSISMPSVSPEGKYLVCSMSDYGYFTIFHRGSDLYSVNVETGEFRKLSLNSNSAESFSAWSSNGRWLVFSSKRIDNVFSRPFIAYIDRDGNAHNPFVLPQKNPEMYDRILANYNLPKFITGKIDLKPKEIREVLLTTPRPALPGI